ncbi:MAG TPA: diacylglycerol kinase family protein [Candidatus Saccharimonadales bacterium]
MEIVVVYNPKSGSAPAKSEIISMCKDTGVVPKKFIAVDESFDAKIKSLAKQDNVKVAVVGGDGTVSSVAGHIAGTGNTLIPLPGGTLNNFTKDLGVPQDLEKALKHLASMKVRKIDVAVVNDKIFVNNSSIGLYPLSLREREQSEKHVGKWQAAAYAVFKVLLKFKTYTVTVDEETFRTPFIFIGNNRYSISSGGVPERSRLDGGKLTVLIAKTSKRWQLIKIFFLVLIGKGHLSEDFEEKHVSSIEVGSKKSRISISHDGEVSKLETPLKYKIEPKALKVIA